jgi:phage head maturation protease
MTWDGTMKKCLPDSLNKADMKDVVALFNHDMNMVLARTSSGTLKLNVTGNAMEYEFEAPKHYIRQ